MRSIQINHINKCIIPKNCITERQSKKINKIKFTLGLEERDRNQLVHKQCSFVCQNDKPKGLLRTYHHIF